MNESCVFVLTMISNICNISTICRSLIMSSVIYYKFINTMNDTWSFELVINWLIDCRLHFLGFDSWYSALICASQPTWANKELSLCLEALQVYVKETIFWSITTHLILADVWVRLVLTTRKEKAIPLSACMASSSVTSSPA